MAHLSCSHPSHKIMSFELKGNLASVMVCVVCGTVLSRIPDGKILCIDFADGEAQRLYTTMMASELA